MKPIRHILLMDDDLDDCDIFTEALAEAARGIRLTCRQNPEEALEDIPSLEPDLIFLDINMPRKNGFECLKDLKSGEDSRHIPVVMYSNSGRPEEIDRALDFGAVLFLKKSSSYSKLVEQLQQILQLDLRQEPERRFIGMN